MPVLPRLHHFPLRQASGGAGARDSLAASEDLQKSRACAVRARTRRFDSRPNRVRFGSQRGASMPNVRCVPIGGTECTTVSEAVHARTMRPVFRDGMYIESARDD